MLLWRLYQAHAEPRTVCGHCMGLCGATSDNAHNLTIWVVMRWCAELHDSLAQMNSIKIVSMSVCCFFNVLLR